MIEKGFQQGIPDKAKAICVLRKRGMSGKMATGGNRELITAVEIISETRIALSPFAIYKGLVIIWDGTYQHLDIGKCKDWKLSYMKGGWNNQRLSVEESKQFDSIPKARLTSY